MYHEHDCIKPGKLNKLQLGGRQAVWQDADNVMVHAALQCGIVATCCLVKGLACLTQTCPAVVGAQKVHFRAQPAALVTCFEPGTNLHGLPAAEGLCVSRGDVYLCAEQELQSERCCAGSLRGCHSHLSSSPQLFYISLTGFKLLLQLHQCAVLHMHLQPYALCAIELDLDFKKTSRRLQHIFHFDCRTLFLMVAYRL